MRMFQSIHNLINKQVKSGNKKRDNNERSVPQYSNTREEHLFACLEKNNYLLKSFFSKVILQDYLTVYLINN